jgi:tetratricopeptide (TPR) repeat protein
LGDLAIYEGRFADAVRVLKQGAAGDLASKNRNAAARKFVWLAYGHLSRGQRGDAVRAAEEALRHTNSGSIRFLAARIFVEAGEVARARAEAARISLGTFNESGIAGPSAQPEAYAKIVEGRIALASGNPREAIKLLREANTIQDTWLGHFDLGRAYLEVPAYAEAAAEFDLCVKRRGEAMALFFDEQPTYGIFPSVYYYQGRVQEGLKNAGLVGMKMEGVAEPNRAYLDIRGTSSDDPLLPEVGRRATP